MADTREFLFVAFTAPFTAQLSAEQLEDKTLLEQHNALCPAFGTSLAEIVQESFTKWCDTATLGAVIETSVGYWICVDRDEVYATLEA